MITDVLLLDAFNTFGFPTSTTVSIVFELLGAAVCVSTIKVLKNGEGLAAVSKYINSDKALTIIMGILLSVLVAFTAGAIIQFFSRLLFTFEFRKRIKRYGAIWGGIALTAITFFILVKGAKGAVLLSEEVRKIITGNSWLIVGISFVIWTIIFQIISIITKFDIFKIIVLAGTFALALAFAANDLVNFIGVPLAGFSAHSAAIKANASNPLAVTMEALQGKAQGNTIFLILSGIVMSVTLWFSKKARSVTKTEVDLGRQEEGMERFGSSLFARQIVRLACNTHSAILKIMPKVMQDKIAKRFDNSAIEEKHDAPAFDVIRASVNLMVASSVISFATSQKLPLSTTYVTFMVAMGSSLSDCAWGRDSAVYRITGVLSVIGGWFLTAIIAFTSSFIIAYLLTFDLLVVIPIALLVVFVIYRTHIIHKTRVKRQEEVEFVNLKKIEDPDFAINTSFDHAGKYLEKINKTIGKGYNGIFEGKLDILSICKKEVKTIQTISNIIIANIFKTLRLLAKLKIKRSDHYGDTIIVIQSIAENLRDIIMRSYYHVNNHHSGLLPVQIEELEKIKKNIQDILTKSAYALQNRDFSNINAIKEKINELDQIANLLDNNQLERIQDRTSKTRLTILFYGFISSTKAIAQNALQLVNIFKVSLDNKNNNS